MICVSASISGLGIAAGQGWTSPALPYLKSNYSELPITESEGTWISSIFDLGLLFGDIITPFISNFMGRKYFLLISTFSQIIPWIIVIYSQRVFMLYIARFIYGIATTIAFSFAVIYIAEISEKNLRGILSLILHITLSFGQLAVKIAGAYLSYKMMNVTMLCITLIPVIILPIIPESPYYLLIRNKKEEALKTLMKLRGTNVEVANSEMLNMENAVRESQNNTKLAFSELFCSKGNRKSLYIVMTALFTSLLAGKISVIAYTQDIYSYSNFSLSPEKSAMVLGTIDVIIVLIGTQAIERFGRRVTYLCCGILTGLGSATVGLFFFLKLYSMVDITLITWMPFIGLIIYTVGMNFGIFSISYVLLGEMFSFKVKVTAIACLNISCDLIIFTSKVLFDSVNSFIGVYANFWMYTVFCFIGTIIFYIIAPETRGKTLEEIQDIIRPDKKQIRKNQMRDTFILEKNCKIHPS